MALFVFPTIQDTIGAMFLGAIFSALCYGITSFQVLVYFIAFPLDSAMHKAAVTSLWILDSLHLCLSIHFVYYYVIGRFGKGIVLDIVWSSKLLSVTNNFIVLLVQSMYAIRVWKVGASYSSIMGYVVAGMIVAGFTVGTLLAYRLYSLKTFLEFPKIASTISTSLASVAVIDLTIAITTFVCLHKSKSVLPQLKSKLTSIIAYTVISGLATSMLAISALLAHVILPNTFIFVAISFVLTQLHVNSFLGLLNLRPRSMRDGPMTSVTLRSPTTSSFKRVSRPTMQEPLSPLPEAEYPASEYTISVSSGPEGTALMPHLQPVDDFTPRAI